VLLRGAVLLREIGPGPAGADIGSGTRA
jgi:hypothetical protein